MAAAANDADAPATQPQPQSQTGVTPATLRAALQEPPVSATLVEIEDVSGGCGQMFNATVVAAAFAGKTALARHRLVNGACKAQIAAVHAWTPKCLTPEEWEKKKKEAGAGGGAA